MFERIPLAGGESQPYRNTDEDPEERLVGLGSERRSRLMQLDTGNRGWSCIRYAGSPRYPCITICAKGHRVLDDLFLRHVSSLLLQKHGVDAPHELLYRLALARFALAAQLLLCAIWIAFEIASKAIFVPACVRVFVSMKREDEVSSRHTLIHISLYYLISWWLGLKGRRRFR